MSFGKLVPVLNPAMDSLVNDISNPVVAGNAPPAHKATVGVDMFLKDLPVWQPGSPEEDAFDKYFAAADPQSARPQLWEKIEKDAKHHLKLDFARCAAAPSTRQRTDLLALIYDNCRSGPSDRSGDFIDTMTLTQTVTLLRELFHVDARNPFHSHLRHSPSFQVMPLHQGLGLSPSFFDAFYDGMQNRDKAGYLLTSLAISGNRIQLRGKPFETHDMSTHAGGKGWGCMQLSGRKHFYGGKRPPAGTALVGAFMLYDADVKVAGGLLNELSLYTGPKVATWQGLQHVLTTLQEQGVNLGCVDVRVWARGAAPHQEFPRDSLIRPPWLPNKPNACKVPARVFLKRPDIWQACP
jgi:hypothetical protein